MCKLLFVLCVVFLYTVLQLPHGGRTADTDLFGFPVDELVSPQLENARNRTPVYIPGKCSVGEILYPGDHDNDWVCDCRPGHVYYPQKDTCYALFTKGHCQQGEYVDLERPSMLVKCTSNSCTGKNMVPFKGQCVELNRHHQVCPILRRIRFVVGVNATTLELDCVESTSVQLPPRAGDGEAQKNIYAGANRCNNGTKSVYNGLCG